MPPHTQLMFQFFLHEDQGLGVVVRSTFEMARTVRAPQRSHTAVGMSPTNAKDAPSRSGSTLGAENKAEGAGMEDSTAGTSDARGATSSASSDAHMSASDGLGPVKC